MDFSELQRRVWLTVDANGFHLKSPRQSQADLLSPISNEAAIVHKEYERSRLNERLMLIVTEVAKACEAARISDWDNFAEELADVVIRVMDTAEQYGIDLEAAVVAKDAKNAKREYKHGKEC